MDDDNDNEFENNLNLNLLLSKIPVRLKTRIFNPPRAESEQDKNLIYIIRSLRNNHDFDDETTCMVLNQYPISRGKDLVDLINKSKQSNPSEDKLGLDFANKFNNKLSYCHLWGKWLVWNGNYWRLDNKGMAIEEIRQILRDTDMPDFRRRSITVKGVEYLAQNDPNLTSEILDWDQNNWLLSTPNGTIELKSGKLRISYPEDKITKITSVSRKKGNPQLWLSFLNDATLNDPEFISYLQRVSGYCLTGDTSEETLFFLYGDGGNGKGVFINTLRGILGDYETVATMSMFAQNKFDGHPTDLAMLKGARLVTAQETEEGKAWNESRIKAMTGGDAITAHFMRQDNFTFMPNFKLLFAGNNKPSLKSVDAAHRRRFHIIPFINKPKNLDKELKEKLKVEYPQILNWMIEGCLEWQKHGLQIPKSVKDATEEYFDEQDNFQHWINECCILNPIARTATEVLFSSWQHYAIRQRLFQGTSTMLAAKLRKFGLIPQTDVPFGKGLRGRGYSGLELKKTEYDRLLESISLGKIGEKKV